MKVGDMNKVAVFKENTPTQLGAGKAPSYSILLTTRGSLTKNSNSRGLSFGELLESGSYTFTTRYQDDLNDNLRQDMKVEIDGRTFSVTGWEKVTEKRFYIKINLSEQRN